MARPKLFRLENAFEEYEHLPNVYVLGSSDAQTRTVRELLSLEGLDANLDTVTLSYPEVRGNEVLRKAIADTYSGVSPDQILITLGATEAIFLALHTLLGGGDEVLVCYPAFQSLYEMAWSAGAKVNFYSYTEQNDFQPDLDVVWRALRGPTAPKVLVLNSPHNPTGQIVNEAALRNILSEAAAVGTTTVVDEVFSGIWHDSTTPVPSAAVLNPKAIVIGSLSKVYGLSGLRIGWLVGPPDFIQACKQWRYYTSNCPPAVVQDLAVVALRHRRTILGQNQAIATANYRYTLNWLQEHDSIFDWVKPQGGLVMLLRLKIPVRTAEFSRDLAEKSQVLLVPCTTCFGMAEGYLRLGLGGEPGRFSEGLTRVSGYLCRRHWQNL